MALNLQGVFSKKSASPEDAKDGRIAVVEPGYYSIEESQENFFRYLYPKDSSQKLTIPQKLVLDVVKTSLQKKDYRERAVPRLPMVIPKLLKSLRDPDSSAREYVEIIKKDPVMSAAVLKLANSVYFNPIGKRIHDIERAVVKLGIDGIRSVLSAAVMNPIIQKDSAYFSQTGQKMWHHSLNCAVACELIAEARNVERFKVYIMGLVHDIGKTTLFSELCSQFFKNGEEVKPGYNAFVPTMKLLGPAVSYWIAKDWDLPKEVCTALAEQTTIKAGALVSPFAHVLYQANLVAESYVTLRHQNESMANQLLEDLDLPTDLYEKLELITREV